MGASSSVQAAPARGKQTRSGNTRFASTELIPVDNHEEVDGGQDEQLRQFVASAASIKAPLLHKLRSVKSFSPDEYARGVVRPLPLLAFMTIQPAAENVGASSLALLPSILSHVEICTTKAGGALYAQKLYQLQSLYAQTQSGGALVRLIRSHPLLVVAALLAALFEGVPGLGGRAAQIARTGSINRLRARVSRVEDSNGVTAAATWPTTKRFLMTTAYFKALSMSEQSDFLVAVEDFTAASVDRVAAAQILNWSVGDSHGVKNGGDDEQARQLLHAILFLGRISYISRNFKAHRAWCTQRVSQLQNVRLGEHREFGFAFFPAQLSDQRFYEAHTYVVNRVLLPYMCSLSMSTSSTVIHEMCVTATLVAKVHGENAERVALTTRRGSDAPLTPVADIESVLAAAPSTGTSLTDKFVKLEGGNGTTAMLYNLFPEEESSRVDVSAVLSVLAVYGVDGSMLG